MGVVSQCFAGATTASLTKLLSMIARRNFRYSQTRALSFLAINCKMEPQKHATRFDLRYDIYSGLWCHKPMKELGFECDFVKLVAEADGGTLFLDEVDSLPLAAQAKLLRF